MAVTSVEGSGGYGREADNGTRQEESDEEYIRGELLELKERRGLDEYVNGLVAQLDTRRLEDRQNEEDKLELAARRDDDFRINRDLAELERMKKEVREKDDLVRRRMSFLGLPTTVSFETKKHSRSEGESERRKGTSERKRSMLAKNPKKTTKVLIDLTADEKNNSQTDSSTLLAIDKYSEEEKRERKRMSDERNYESFLKCEDLKKEYARCYPRCTVPNYHLPWRFIEDLKNGETYRMHERDIPRKIKDGEEWSKDWCTVEKKYI